jgi:hypothetical protein
MAKGRLMLLLLLPVSCFLHGAASLKFRALQSPLAMAVLSCICIGAPALFAVMLATPVVLLGEQI